MDPLIVNPNDYPNVKCQGAAGKCRCETYANVYRFKVIPATVSKTGKPDPLASSTWICSKCGKENVDLRAEFKAVTQMLMEQLDNADSQLIQH